MELKWDKVNREKLEELFYEKNMSDNMIADLYHISKGKVQYKRKKYGITIHNKLFKSFEDENSDLFQTLNSHSKERLLNEYNIDGIAKALTHYIFRNGPVEDMHTEGKIGQADMKTLNKYMVNRIAGILNAVHKGDWLKLELLYAYYQPYGIGWDTAIPDEEELNLIYDEMMRETKSKLK